jgi:hypothetical protein
LGWRRPHHHHTSKGGELEIIRDDQARASTSIHKRVQGGCGCPQVLFTSSRSMPQGPVHDAQCTKHWYPPCTCLTYLCTNIPFTSAKSASQVSQFWQASHLTFFCCPCFTWTAVIIG